MFSKLTPNITRKFERQLELEHNTYDHQSFFRRPQPYNDSLIYLGEIRAFVVNGVIFKALVTIPQADNCKLEVLQPLFITPLSKLRLVEFIYLTLL